MLSPLMRENPNVILLQILHVNRRWKKENLNIGMYPESAIATVISCWFV